MIPRPLAVPALLLFAWLLAAPSVAADPIKIHTAQLNTVVVNVVIGSERSTFHMEIWVNGQKQEQTDLSIPGIQPLQAVCYLVAIHDLKPASLPLAVQPYTTTYMNGYVVWDDLDATWWFEGIC